ncbi:MAG: hypothetical protein EOO20_13040 [Chryseobacterium sp.]|nr:MAG: hypothetical protein EOO20_13040 [Chryseobacterium sp.]
MKKIFLISVLGVAVTSTLVVAQQKQNKGDRITRAEARANADVRAKRLTERMNADLTLSADQKDKVYNVALKHFSAQESTADARQKFNTELDQVLTESQKVQRAELEAQKKDRMQRVAPQRGELKKAPGKATTVK